MTTQPTPEHPNPLIYAAISAVMADINPIGKDRQADKYKFRGIDEVYNEVHNLLAKHGLFTRADILETKHEEGQFKGGGAYKQITLTVRWYFHAKDGSFITHDTVGIGQDSGDKAANKAMSVSHKYALLQVFAIPTQDPKDPENDNKPVAGKKPAEQPKAAPTAGAAPKAADLTPEQRFTAFQADIEKCKTEAELQQVVNKVFASYLAPEKKADLKKAAGVRKAALQSAAPSAAAA